MVPDRGGLVNDEDLYRPKRTDAGYQRRLRNTRAANGQLTAEAIAYRERDEALWARIYGDWASMPQVPVLAKAEFEAITEARLGKNFGPLADLVATATDPAMARYFSREYEQAAEAYDHEERLRDVPVQPPARIIVITAD